MIDAREEYLNIKATKTQVKLKTIPKENDIAIIIPKYTATPLPPLNFNHIGNICPIKHISADK